MSRFPSLILALAASSSMAVAGTQNVVFSEDFESGYSRWTMTNLWNAQSDSEPCTTVAEPFPSGSNCVWFGSSATCSFEPGIWDFQYLTCTEPIALPATAGTLELRFRSFSEGEDDGFWDSRKPQISNDDGATWSSIATVLSSSTWLHERQDISKYAGQTVRLRFEFWIGDSAANDYLGWLIDDVEIVEHAGPAVEQCYGDGTWYACPCSNNGAPGRGCASSFNPAGARIAATGSASLSNDTLAFAADGMSEAAATIFQGGNFSHSPWGVIAGDGFACFAGPYVRVRTLPAPGGSIAYPGALDAPISVTAAITTPWTTRYYAVRYRNALNFCTSATFNLTNTLQITWRP